MKKDTPLKQRADYLEGRTDARAEVLAFLLRRRERAWKEVMKAYQIDNCIRQEGADAAHREAQNAILQLKTAWRKPKVVKRETG